jgi:hypothetical protein
MVTNVTQLCGLGYVKYVIWHRLEIRQGHKLKLQKWNKWKVTKMNLWTCTKMYKNIQVNTLQYCQWYAKKYDHKLYIF